MKKIGCYCFTLGIDNTPGFIALWRRNLGWIAEFDGGNSFYVQCKHGVLLITEHVRILSARLSSP